MAILTSHNQYEPHLMAIYNSSKYANTFGQIIITHVIELGPYTCHSLDNSNIFSNIPKVLA